jgi:hypothetical protein
VDANSIQGEANLTFDGTTLTLTGIANIQDNGTNSTNKFARITGSHFLNAEEDILAFQLRGDTNDNILSIGGSNSSYNAVEYIDFYTAANYNTVTGTQRLRIDNAGNLDLQGNSGWGILNVGAAGWQGNGHRSYGESDWQQ